MVKSVYLTSHFPQNYNQVLNTHMIKENMQGQVNLLAYSIIFLLYSFYLFLLYKLYNKYP